MTETPSSPVGNRGGSGLMPLNVVKGDVYVRLLETKGKRPACWAKTQQRELRTRLSLMPEVRHKSLPCTRLPSAHASVVEDGGRAVNPSEELSHQGELTWPL